MKRYFEPIDDLTRLLWLTLEKPKKAKKCPFKAKKQKQISHKTLMNLKTKLFTKFESFRSLKFREILTLTIFLKSQMQMTSEIRKNGNVRNR